MYFTALAVFCFFALSGLIAVFFTQFGTLLILTGTVLFAFMTRFEVIGAGTLAWVAGLYAAGEVFENLAVILGAKRFGSSNAAVAGALIGGIAGAVAGAAFMGMGILPGTFLGIFAGAFLVELFIKRDVRGSIRAGIGSMMGRAGAILFKSAVGILMITITVTGIIGGAKAEKDKSEAAGAERTARAMRNGFGAAALEGRGFSRQKQKRGIV
ncbi:MAG: DUF456 family protein [Candidatus Omnitrophica bacterium]|nr:DUF456 family protein [Candidatus Omnitrophota bacterium]